MRLAFRGAISTPLLPYTYRRRKMIGAGGNLPTASVIGAFLI